MLRANIGVSRKVSRDYQSTGYQVNLDGEIPYSPDDAEGVLEKIRELFDLAHEAVRQEIDRDQGPEVGDKRPKPVPTPAPIEKARPNGRISHTRPASNDSVSNALPPVNGNGSPNGHGNGSTDQATNKQIQFILTMGKRLNLNTAQIADEIHKIVGRECGVYDLSKKEAGQILDFWTTQVPA